MGSRTKASWAVFLVLVAGLAAAPAALSADPAPPPAAPAPAAAHAPAHAPPAAPAGEAKAPPMAEGTHDAKETEAAEEDPLGGLFRPKAYSAAAMWLVGIILVAIYVVIGFEIWHRTLAAFVGTAILVGVTYIGGFFTPDLQIIGFDRAMKKAVDWNVIFLLFSMMIVVGVLKETGVFQWCAYKAFALAKGKTFRMAALFMALTAFVSANLDNVTTMLLIAPVTIEVCKVLKIPPLALLVPEVLASNVGGTATLIGDPPNIIIGSKARLDYFAFIVNLAPCIFLVMVAHILQMRWVYRKEYARQMSPEEIRSTLERLRADYRITNQALLNWGIGILAIVIGLFFLGRRMKLPFESEAMYVAVPAMLGAAFLVVIRDRLLARRRAAHPAEEASGHSHGILQCLEKEVEWPTLFFFIFLFVIVQAADDVGLIRMIAIQVDRLSGGNLMAQVLLTLWISAIASAFIDNIPFTMTMIPLLQSLGAQAGTEKEVLWWALALGACLGGNGTVIGASANVVTAGLAEKAGCPITFGRFMRVGFPAMIVEVLICTAWLLWLDEPVRNFFKGIGLI